MEKIYYDTIKETLYHEILENGLNVYLLKKQGFSKTYGLFSTQFGSIDTSFVPLNETNMIKVEDGVAHFLEHKMFEMQDGDASDKFSMLGASTNAFTSSSRTAYLFSTATNIDECVELLLDFVQDIYLTNETVEKEKGIITQEISMYDDDADWRSYFGSIANLYQKHPVAIDIAGTSETVNKTTKQMLEKCYRTFYHPSNMMLFVVGNLEPEKMMTVIKNNQSKKHFEKPQPIIRNKIIEPSGVEKAFEVLKMEVTIPKLMIGIKVNDILVDPHQKIKREIAMNILLDILFSKSSPIYEELLEKGWINNSFGAGFTQERDYCFIQIGGDSNCVEELRHYLENLLDHIEQFHIDENVFERIKRKTIGHFINSFNSPESIANMFSRYYFEGIFSFEIIDVVSNMTLDDVNEIKKYLTSPNRTVFVVEAKS